MSLCDFSIHDTLLLIGEDRRQVIRQTFPVCGCLTFRKESRFLRYRNCRLYFRANGLKVIWRWSLRWKIREFCKEVVQVYDKKWFSLHCQSKICENRLNSTWSAYRFFCSKWHNRWGGNTRYSILYSDIQRTTSFSWRLWYHGICTRS